MRVRADCQGLAQPQDCVHRDRRRPCETTVQPSRRQKPADFQAPAPTVFTPLVGCALRQALCERPGRSALHLHRARCPKELPSPDPLEHGPRRHKPDASTFLQPHLRIASCTNERVRPPVHRNGTATSTLNIIVQTQTPGPLPHRDRGSAAGSGLALLVGLPQLLAQDDRIITVGSAVKRFDLA